MNERFRACTPRINLQHSGNEHLIGIFESGCADNDQVGARKTASQGIKIYGEKVPVRVWAFVPFICLEQSAGNRVLAKLVFRGSLRRKPGGEDLVQCHWAFHLIRACNEIYCLLHTSRIDRPIGLPSSAASFPTFSVSACAISRSTSR